MAQMLAGLRKQFINNFVYPTWACAAGFNNNNNFYVGRYFEPNFKFIRNLDVNYLLVIA